VYDPYTNHFMGNLGMALPTKAASHPSKDSLSRIRRPMASPRTLQLLKYSRPKVLLRASPR